MSEGIVYLLFLLSLLFVLIALYSGFCAIDIIRKKNFKLNIWKLILLKLRKLKKLQFLIVISATLISAMLSLLCIGFGASLYSLDYGMKTAAIIATQDNDDKCRCYVKCTGDPSIDSKCPYELLFGPNKYEKFIKEMKKDISPGEAEEFDKLTTGEDISNFIIANLTQGMVERYRKDLDSGSLIGTKLDDRDGIKRLKLSIDELKADLIKLLSDYKELGRNQSCNCKSMSTMELENNCLGVKHWVKGWTWQPVYETTPGGTGGPDDPIITTDDTYVIEIDGKRYFWYEQNSKCLTCQYCGDWSKKVWGNGNDSKILANNGCAVYSLAIAVSNLKGQAITPAMILETLGCTISGDFIDTTTSTAFTGTNGRDIYYERAAKAVCAAYGLEYKLLSESTSAVDDILDSGGYVWTRWVGGPPGWYSGTGHFMVIRGHDSSNYYKFDPVKSNSSFSAGTPKSTIFNTLSGKPTKSPPIIALWNPNPPAWGNGAPQPSDEKPPKDDTPIGNVELYNKLSSNSKYSAKALALTTAYTKAVPLYGENFAVGLMANILAEGNAGQIEGMWVYNKGSSSKELSKCSCNGSSGKYVYSYWTKVSCSVHAIAGKKISSMNDINTLLSIPSDVSGIGVGCIQWSHSRRAALLNKYKSSASGFSDDQLLSVEVQFMLDELAGGYKGVVNNCSGKSASDCASIICKQYEKPDNMNVKASERATAATELYKFIHN